MNIYAEADKIINLLKNEQIDWGQPYKGEKYTIQIPEYDEDDFLEDNLTLAEADILLQLSVMRQQGGAKKQAA